MITTDRETQGLANLYAVMLTVYCSQDSMPTTLQVGLVCRTTLELANLKFHSGDEVDEPYELLTTLVASNLTTDNKKRRISAASWGDKKCRRAVDRDFFGVTHMSVDEDSNRRVKHYFLTQAGEEEFDRIQAAFDLAYLKPEADVIGFGLTRRD